MTPSLPVASNQKISPISSPHSVQSTKVSPASIIGSACGMRILRKVCKVEAPNAFARCSRISSPRLDPVTEFSLTIGPEASATATIGAPARSPGAGRHERDHRRRHHQQDVRRHGSARRSETGSRSSRGRSLSRAPIKKPTKSSRRHAEAEPRTARETPRRSRSASAGVKRGREQAADRPPIRRLAYCWASPQSENASCTALWKLPPFIGPPPATWIASPMTAAPIR